MKRTSTNDQELELECSTTDLNEFRKLKRMKKHITELNNIRNSLITSAQNISEHCCKNSDINKIYNEICSAVDVYTKLIDTYNNHVKRLERNNGF